MLSTPRQPREIKILDGSGRYRVLELIGCGATGCVYEAIDTTTGRHLAVKIVHERPPKENFKKFRQEIDTLVALKHPNIGSVLSVVDCEDNRVRKPCVMMPFLDGTTLADIIAEAERVTLERSLQIILQVCQGLRAAHEKDIVHGHLRPSNIFVRPSGDVQILDFGQACLVGVKPILNRQESFRYMPPEQLFGGDVDKRSDLFSLGVIFYELLTGQHPFIKGKEIGPGNIQFRRPVVATKFNPDVTASVCCVLDRLLQKDRRWRIQAVQFLIDDLQKVLDGKTLEYCDLKTMEQGLAASRAALQESRFEDAAQQLDELVSAGNWHPRIEELREEIESAKTAIEVRRLLQEAEELTRAGKFELAIGRLNSVVEMDTENGEASRRLAEVSKMRDDRHVANLAAEANTCLENENFPRAETLLRQIQEYREDHPQAGKLARQIAQRKGEFDERNGQLPVVYEKTVKAFESGNITTAALYAKDLLRLSAAKKAAADPRYEDIRSKVESAHSFLAARYEEAQKLIQERKMADAQSVCEKVLADYAGDVRFRALLTTLKNRQVEMQSADIASFTARANAEADLTRKIEILEQGLAAYPAEQRFVAAIQSARDLRQVVMSVVETAKELEEQEDFQGALTQYETLRATYPQYPDLDFQIQVLNTRLQGQALQNAKVNVIEEVRNRLAEQTFDSALEVIEEAKQFHGDAEIEQLRKESQETIGRRSEAQSLCDRAAEHIRALEFAAAIPLLEKARQLSPDHSSVDALLVESYYGLARAQSSDWNLVEELLSKISLIEPKSEKVAALTQLLHDKKRNDFIGETMSRADELRFQGNLAQATTVLEEGLRKWPNDRRMYRLLEEIRAALGKRQRDEVIAEARSEAQRLQLANKWSEADELIKNALNRYPGDAQLERLLERNKTGRRGHRKSEAAANIVADIRSLEAEDTVTALEKALTKATKALSDHPDDPGLLECKDRILHRLNDVAAQGEAMKERILRYVERKHYDEASTLVRQAIEAAPADRALRRLAVTVRRRQRFDSLLSPKKLSLVAAMLVLGLLSVRYAPFLAFLQPSLRSLPMINVRRDEVKPATKSQAETLSDSLNESAARLSAMPYSDAGFLDEVDRFVTGESQLQVLDPTNASLHERAERLRTDLKRRLDAKFADLSPADKNSERALPLMTAISRIDPADTRAAAWIAAYPGALGRMKADIDTAIRQKALLTSDRGSALGLLDQLQASFPSEAPYIEAKRYEVRSGVFRTLEERCRNRQSPACGEYGKRVLQDFADDRDQVSAMTNVAAAPQPAPRVTPPQPAAAAPVPAVTAVVDPPPSRELMGAPAPTSAPNKTVAPVNVPAPVLPPPAAPPPPSPVVLKVRETFTKMNDAFNAKRYVQPANDSSAAFAQEIMGLARANPDAVAGDARPLVYEAEAVLSQSLSFADQEANTLTRSYAEALLSRDKALEVQKKFVRARELVQAIAAYKSVSDSPARLRSIDTRLSDLGQIANSAFSYAVRAEDGRTGECDGMLTVDAYSVKFVKSTGKCENFTRKFDDIQFYRNQMIVEFRSTQSSERWQFQAPDNNASREAKDQKAREILDSVMKLAKLRERFNKP